MWRKIGCKRIRRIASGKLVLIDRNSNSVFWVKFRRNLIIRDSWRASDPDYRPLFWRSHTHHRSRGKLLSPQPPNLLEHWFQLRILVVCVCQTFVRWTNWVLYLKTRFWVHLICRRETLRLWSGLFFWFPAFSNISDWGVQLTLRLAIRNLLIEWRIKSVTWQSVREYHWGKIVAICAKL